MEDLSGYCEGVVFFKEILLEPPTLARMDPLILQPAAKKQLWEVQVLQKRSPRFFCTSSSVHTKVNPHYEAKNKVKKIIVNK